jgi:hypothetical protein
MMNKIYLDDFQENIACEIFERYECSREDARAMVNRSHMSQFEIIVDGVLDPTRKQLEMYVKEIARLEGLKKRDFCSL